MRRSSRDRLWRRLAAKRAPSKKARGRSPRAVPTTPSAVDIDLAAVRAGLICPDCGGELSRHTPARGEYMLVPTMQPDGSIKHRIKLAPWRGCGQCSYCVEETSEMAVISDAKE